MGEVINLGPFMIQYRLIIDIFGLIAGFVALMILIKRCGKPDHKKLLDVYMTAILLPIAIWKFGPTFFHPITIIRNPLMLFYFAGNDLYWLVGILLSALYVLYRSRKDRLGLLFILDSFVFAFLAFVLVSNLCNWKYGLPTFLPWGISIYNTDFKYHPINIYNLILVLVIIIRFSLKRFETGKGGYLFEFLILFGTGKMIISYFTFQNGTLILLSAMQWFYLAMIVIGALIYHFREWEKIL